LNPSGNGILIALALSSAMAMLLRCKSWNFKFVLLSIPIYLIGIVCTMTRCAWMGGMAALVACAIAMTPKKWQPRALGFVLTFGIVGMSASANNLLSFKRDKAVSVEQMRQSAELRPILAMVAWRMFQDRPLLGCGTGQYKSVAKHYLYDRNTALPLEKVRPYVQHNIFLALLSENGLLGLVPFCVLLVIWSLWAWRLWHCATVGLEYRQVGLVFFGTLLAYLFNGMFQDVLIVPMINSYLFFLAGCVRNSIAHLPQANTRTVNVHRTSTSDGLQFGRS
jgi:O-antigen ligase